MQVSSKKTNNRWSNPFKNNAKGTKENKVKPCKGGESSNADTAAVSDDSLAPTSVSSDLSLSPQWDMTEISHPAPVFKPVQESSAKYGYEEASPSATETYGYGDATPDDKYGYGNAKPDDKYGYGNAKPDDGDTTPDDKAKYGYGDDAAPDDKAKYGYGDDDDDTTPRVSSSRTPRRSSMKQSGVPRRSSIQFGGEIQVNLPGKKRPVRRRTSISFNETINIKNVVPVSQLTDEPEALWFQDEEYDRILDKSYSLVDRVEERGDLPGGKKYCVRGLEKLMAKNADGLKQRKYDLWDSVLDEQDLQRHHGTFDDEFMGNICKSSTEKSHQEAVGRATQDAAEIENYLRSTRKMCRRLSM
jgi:hypothetical protein